MSVQSSLGEFEAVGEAEDEAEPSSNQIEEAFAKVGERRYFENTSEIGLEGTEPSRIEDVTLFQYRTALTSYESPPDTSGYSGKILIGAKHQDTILDQDEACRRAFKFRSSLRGAYVLRIVKTVDRYRPAYTYEVSITVGARDYSILNEIDYVRTSKNSDYAGRQFEYCATVRALDIPYLMESLDADDDQGGDK
jgi:hypothetical protein